MIPLAISDAQWAVLGTGVPAMIAAGAAWRNSRQAKASAVETEKQVTPPANGDDDRTLAVIVANIAEDIGKIYERMGAIEGATQRHAVDPKAHGGRRKR